MFTYLSQRNQLIIIPGITDGHAHYLMKFINEQMKDNTLQFTDTQDYDSVINQVSQFVEKARSEGRQLEYVYGEGYDPSKMKGEDGKDRRHRKDLDDITTEIPIYLTGFDHHSTLVNTRAMINAGILNEKGDVTRDRIAGRFLLGNYSNSPVDSIFSGHGTALWTEEDMNILVEAADEKGLTVHTHAMGDGAVHRSVKAYAQAYDELGNRDFRNCIVHLRNVSTEDYAEIKRG